MFQIGSTLILYLGYCFLHQNQFTNRLEGSIPLQDSLKVVNMLSDTEIIAFAWYLFHMDNDNEKKKYILSGQSGGIFCMCDTQFVEA